MDTYRTFQNKIQKIAEWVREQYPSPVCQTEVMQKFRIRKSEILRIEEELMNHRMVFIDPFPNNKSVKGTSVWYHRREEGNWPIEDEDEEWNEGEPEEEGNYPESVYFALAPEYNRMKIGWTTGSVKKRVADVSQGSFTRIVVFGAITDKGYDYEQYLHRVFKEHHVRNEWFIASEIVRDVVLLPGFSVQLHSHTNSIEMGNNDG